VLAALDADSGRELWQTRYPAPYKPGSPAVAHGAGPKATPLFHRGKLFTLGISGIVSAFDAATWKLVWQKPAPPQHPFCATAVSPIGDEGWSSSTLAITPIVYGETIIFRG
jgi:outer membrane protein assembly factor BamB